MYLQYSNISKEYTAQANEDPNRLKFDVKGCRMKERRKKLLALYSIIALLITTPGKLKHAIPAKLKTASEVASIAQMPSEPADFREPSMATLAAL